jgi:hypothetical protein
MLAAVTVTTVACGQNPKVKTITIINGDTTISESNLDEELSKIDKNITISINDEGKEGKTIVKKIIIDNGKEGGKDHSEMAYAYSSGDEADADVEISTDNDGKTTKVIVKSAGDEKGEKAEKTEKDGKTIVRRSSSISKGEKESMSLNINVNKGIAKVDIATGSKEPINISVLDENGKQIFYDSQKDGSKYSKEIKLEKKGTYFMNIIQNKKSTTEKIIVE